MSLLELIRPMPTTLPSPEALVASSSWTESSSPHCSPAERRSVGRRRVGSRRCYGLGTRSWKILGASRGQYRSLTWGTFWTDGSSTEPRPQSSQTEMHGGKRTIPIPHPQLFQTKLILSLAENLNWKYLTCIPVYNSTSHRDPSNGQVSS
jgi:hypothetical protein